MAVEKIQGIKAIAFDAFGTLVEITEKRRPYRLLMQHLADLGRTPQPSDGVSIMTNNVGLYGAARMFDADFDGSVLSRLETVLFEELASIRAFNEVDHTLIALKEAGFKIGLCSNLAAPYAAPIKILLPFELDFYAWSFEVGAVKPDQFIYEKLCAGLDCRPCEVLMIGDTIEADYIGPRDFGMNSFHLVRNINSGKLGSIATLDGILEYLK